MGHFYAPDEVFDLPVSGYAKLILLNLCRRANKDGSSFPSKNRIASDCGISKRSVYKYIKELEDNRLIQKRNIIGRSSTYVLSEGIVNISKSNHINDESRQISPEGQANFAGVPRQSLPTKEYTLKEYTYKEASNINTQLNNTPNIYELTGQEVEHFMEQWTEVDWDDRKILDFEASQLVPFGCPITCGGKRDPLFDKYRALMKRGKACTKIEPIKSAV
ncbi:MAG: helix-turn-helix domain-containing protein [Candidatus Dadabacteria bacterium]|nr:helix-turn-helix domain-containing protein [Candidatus Dadabacteria bacterium]NIS07583.1 helix-turn-helix domain-containing protein [Candidatus Dadabacteria bacterium]NIY21217.1 hypothetical protein [Candidatus Dadabacteria bacterium]